MKTTEFINNRTMDYSDEEKCHGGQGVYRFKNLISAMDQSGKQYIKFIHDDILLPGTTFGNHKHKSDAPVEEWYYCISGRGTMYLDGQEFEMLPGDICVCRANGTHGLVNNGTEDLRIIVVYAAPIEA